MKQERGLYRRGKIWWIRYSANGQFFKESTQSTNKAFALRCLNARREAVALGRFRLADVKPRKEISFEEMAAAYLEKYAAVNKRPMSARRDQCLIKALSVMFGGRLISRIETREVEEYKQRRLNGLIDGKKPRPATVNRELQALRGMFNKVIQGRIFESAIYNTDVKNPVAGVKLLPEHNTRTEFLREDEIGRLLQAARNDSPNYHNFLFALLCTGCRVGELINLTWDSVDFHARHITLQSTNTKSKQTRQISINSQLFRLLAELKLAMGKTNQHVFLSPKGEPWFYRTFLYTFQIVVGNSGIGEDRRKAGRPRLRPHDLRHTFASHLAMTSKDLNLVREALGHQSMAMTLRYSHLTKEYQHQKMQEMADAIFTPNGISTGQ